MDGTRLKFESWKVQNDIENASQYSIAFWKKSESWNPAIAMICCANLFPSWKGGREQTDKHTK